MPKIIICEDFSDIPGGRYINEGLHSGEEFRDNLLYPKYIEAKENNKELVIDFDGCYGFGTSFLEEAFGGLVRKYREKGVFKKLSIISTEDETIPDNIKKYIVKAEGEIND